MEQIYDMIERGEAEAPSHKKSKTPLQLMIGEMNRMSQKKATLIKYAEEEHKLKVTPNDAINSIQRRLLNHFMSTVTPVGEDMMGFGKFSAMTYRHVLENEVKYVEWAKQTSQEGDCSPYLCRFVRWVNDADFEDELVIPTPAKRESTKSKSPPTKKGYPSKTPSEPPSAAAASSSSTEQAVMQLANVVTALMKEVQDLKEEKPRKITARADVPMEKPKDKRLVFRLHGFWTPRFRIWFPGCLRN